jgi:hypothetical protein
VVPELLTVESITLEFVDEHGISNWLTTATIADAQCELPAKHNPPDDAYPAEYCPGICEAMFQLEDGELPPPISGTEQDQIDFLTALDLDWALVED